jgi:DNA-binding NtrC family response regulator
VSVTPRAKRKEEEDLPRGSETILLVDDEDFLRELGKEMLERFGYTVLIADRGESAVEIYREKRERISLVILDLMMPGMGGKKCLEELLRMNPLVNVVIASGYSINEPMREALDEGAKGFIRKPYELRQMLKTVREVLD